MGLAILLAVLSFLPVQDEKSLNRTAGGLRLGDTFSMPEGSYTSGEIEGNRFYTWRSDDGGLFTAVVSPEGTIIALQQEIRPTSLDQATGMRAGFIGEYGDLLTDHSDDGDKFEDTYADRYTQWKIRYDPDLLLLIMLDLTYRSGGAAEPVVEREYLPQNLKYFDYLFVREPGNLPHQLGDNDLGGAFAPGDIWTLVDVEGEILTYEYKFENGGFNEMHIDAQDRISGMTMKLYSRDERYIGDLKAYLKARFGAFLMEETEEDAYYLLTFAARQPGGQTTRLTLIVAGQTVVIKLLRPGT